MKRCIKLGVLLLIFVFLNFFITFNNTYEIETNVQAKYSGLDCLHKYGGEISNLKFMDNNDLGGKVTMDIKGAFDHQYKWTGTSKIIDVGVYSKTFQTLKAINYKIYINSGDLCTGSIDNIDKSQSAAEFRVTFSKTAWVYFEVTGVDTSKNGNIGKETRLVRVDKEAPQISDVEITINSAGNLNVQFVGKDYYSGISSVNVSINVYKDSNKLSGYSVNSTKIDDHSSYFFKSFNITEGNYKAVISVEDGVGNKSETKEIPFSVTNSNGKMLVNMNTSQTTTGQGGTTNASQSGTTNASQGGTTTQLSPQQSTQQSSQEGVLPSKTNLTNFSIGDSQKIICDPDIQNFVKYAWKYALILAPILLIVMITVDFSKAIMSSNEDLLKKASSNAIKRTIATLLLLCLPLLLSTILDFFGLELCM